MKKIIFAGLISLLTCLSLKPRGPLHFIDPNIPVIYTKWQWNFPEEKMYFPSVDNENYKFSNGTITEFPLFKTFDMEDVKNNYLPEENIPYRNDKKSFIQGKKFEKMLKNFFKEILQKKDTYSDFTILKDDDWNRKKQAGLLVVRCKKHPFVIKLFMETPKSFMHPFNKGIIPLFQFGIGGGATRHLVGFTRIKNSNTIMKLLLESPEWKDYAEVPRKWYWLPQYPWIHITTKNLGEPNEIKTITIPGAYMIIADFIDTGRTFKLSSKTDRTKILNLCNYLQCRVDPHINNFLVEKGTNKLVLIDTEHFPTLTGLQKPIDLRSYTQFYLHLSGKYAHETVFCLKNHRQSRRVSGYQPFCTP